jgi:DNA-binding CsgD family transcriptional regulator
MARLDYVLSSLSDYACDPRCPDQFAAGYNVVLSGLAESSSLTSRRYPIWPLVRANLDGALEVCIAGYSGVWAKELLSGASLSEMAQQPPQFCAMPCTESSGSLAAKVVASEFVTAKPEGMPEVDWQLLNMDRWDANLRFAIRSLLGPKGLPLSGAEALCGALESVRELFRLLRHFRPKRTGALVDFDALQDDRTRPQGEAYCALCWRLSIRSRRLQELDAQEKQEVGKVVRAGRFTGGIQETRWAQALMLKVCQHLPRSCALLSKAEVANLRAIFDRFRAERIVAGNLSRQYCSVHQPGSPKYHADLRYLAAFQHHLSVLTGAARSEFAFNLRLPDAADLQEVRKVAYDQVHSGLHAIAPSRRGSLGLREKVWMMHQEGMSQSEMARRLGISRQAISKAKKSLESLMNAHHAGSYLNPTTGEAQVPHHVREAIGNCLARGLPVAAIAKQVRLTKGTVDGLVRMMRVPFAHGEVR